MRIRFIIIILYLNHQEFFMHLFLIVIDFFIKILLSLIIIQIDDVISLFMINLFYFMHFFMYFFMDFVFIDHSFLFVFMVLEVEVGNLTIFLE
jgi:hypothetical protein